MNSQEIFDKVAEHLLTQNCRSVKKDALGMYPCVYRTTEGLKCAIGCLIPEELYDPLMEGLPVETLLRGFIELREYVPEVSLAKSLQTVHDLHPPEAWRDELKSVAWQYRLSTVVLDIDKGSKECSNQE